MLYFYNLLVLNFTLLKPGCCRIMKYAVHPIINNPTTIRASGINTIILILPFFCTGINLTVVLNINIMEYTFSK